MAHPLRSPCTYCGGSDGRIITVNGQDTVRCADCDRYQYNAPKTETGRKPRTVQTVHDGITAKLRARVLLRENGQCAICGSRHNLHVGHMLSVADGLTEGLTEAVLNSMDNLAAMCAACNLGMGDEPVPLRLAVAIVRRRAARRTANEASTAVQDSSVLDEAQSVGAVEDR